MTAEQMPVYRHWDFKGNRVPTLEQAKNLALTKLLREILPGVAMAAYPEVETKGREATQALIDDLRKAYTLSRDEYQPKNDWTYWYSDDGTDYLRAALRNASRLVTWDYYHNYEEFGKWLSEHPSNWLACDGEIRHDLFCYQYIAKRREDSKNFPFQNARCPDWDDCISCSTGKWKDVPPVVTS